MCCSGFHFSLVSVLRPREVTRLDMSHNPMTYLGEESVSMPKLTHLYLSHMSLQDLSDKALSGAPLLSHFDLSHNQLRYLEPVLGPEKLSTLNLTGTTDIFHRHTFRCVEIHVFILERKLLFSSQRKPHVLQLLHAAPEGVGEGGWCEAAGSL